MRNTVDERAIILGEYIIENDATVRAAAKQFKISKSTVHKDVTERLKSNDPVLWKQVNVVLQKNKTERHIRGGMATRRTYEGEEHFCSCLKSCSLSKYIIFTVAWQDSAPAIIIICHVKIIFSLATEILSDFFRSLNYNLPT